MAKKILVAIDGSEPSMKAVRYVGETVLGCKEIEITLFSILPEIPHELYKGLSDELKQMIPGFESKLGSLADIRHLEEGELRKALEEAKGVLVSFGIPEDKIEIKVKRKKEGVARDILREVEKYGYDTIVVGRRGKAGAFFIGSVSTKVVNNARNCAVWVVD